MFAQLSELRRTYWSDLCNTDKVAYAQYLLSCDRAVQNGLRLIETSGVDGATNFVRRDGCGADDGFRVVFAGLVDGVDAQAAVVDGNGVDGGVVGAEDNGDCRLGSETVGLECRGISTGGVGDLFCGVPHGGGGQSVQSHGSGRSVDDASVDGRSVGQTPLNLRGAHYLRNAKKRQKKRARALAEVGVPEWRRKTPTGVHKGVFSECSSETQAQLRETRAAMLVERNKLSVLKAEAEARRVEAQLKSQVIERGIEVQRIKQDSELAKLVRAREAGQPQGFAETVVSEGLTSSLGTPSLSDGSVSPDSSISVAELNKLRDSYAYMVQQVHDLTMKTVRQQEELTRVKTKSTVVAACDTTDDFFDADEGAVGVGDRRFDAFHFGDRFAF